MTCFVEGNLALCRTECTREIIGRTNKRWCFNCRIQIVHDRVLYSEILRYDEKGNLINGYYGGRVDYECRRCHQEHLLFPGREWAE